MILAFLSFFVSLVFIFLMLLNKSRELSTGRAFFKFHHHLDEKIKGILVSFWNRLKFKVGSLSKKITRRFVCFSVDLSRKLKNVIYPKISHIVDSVKGTNLPKEKKASSFFLVHIREYKEKIKAQNENVDQVIKIEE